MKKSLLILLIIVSIFSFVNVYADSRNELVKRIDGTIFSKYKDNINNYLDKFEVSSKDIKYIDKQLNNLIKIANKKHITNINEFEKKCSTDIRATINNISDSTGVNLKLLSNGKLRVSKYNSKDTYIILNTQISGSSGSPYLIYVAGFVSIVGSILLVYRVRNEK